jgi:class 3 adenylate cyclase
MESSSRTLVCSVLFLDIVEYSKKPVAEQLQLKQAFNHALSASLEQVPARDRIILDTGDGAAVTFMGDPEDALFAAMSVRDLATTVPVRLGVNLGPVRLVKDLNAQINIIGDGINVAQRVMSFSRPGQLLVSRSFYEVVSCLSRDYLGLFRHEGSRTDKHVREHEVYSVVGGIPAARRLAETESQIRAQRGGWIAGMGPLGLRRSALVAAPLAFFLLVGGGVAARSLLEPAAPRPQAPAAAPAEAKPAPAQAEAKPAADKGFADKALVAQLEKRLERVEKAAKAGPAQIAAAKPVQPGRLELAVAPWGEIVVNGRTRGVSPPLQVLEIPAGTHRIEIRNSTFPSHVERVEVKAGETTRIRHRFK